MASLFLVVLLVVASPIPPITFASSDQAPAPAESTAAVAMPDSNETPPKSAVSDSARDVSERALIQLQMEMQRAGQESIAVVNAARRASVHVIDSLLPDATFESWFRELVGPGTPIQWDSHDCGDVTSGVADSTALIPLCAEASAEWDNGTAFVWLLVGTRNRGVGVVTPAVTYWQVNEEYSASQTSLSDFARAVRDARGR